MYFMMLKYFCRGQCGFNNTGCECTRGPEFPFDPLFEGEYCADVVPP